MAASNGVKKYFWECMGAYCRVCGYDKSIRSLHCHHLDKSQKTSNNDTLGVAITQGSAKLKEWCKRTKFVILCANCHGELHDGYWTLPDDYLGDNLLFSKALNYHADKMLINIINACQKDDGINRQSHHRRIVLPKKENVTNYAYKD